MTSSVVRVRTLFALGIPNLMRVALYRVGLRTGLHPVCRLRAVAPTGPFFRWPVRAAPVGAEPRSEWRYQGSLFGHVSVVAGDAAPDWMTSVVTGRRSPAADCPWWKIGDFDPAVGDIKAIWELSRFDWLLAMAQRATVGEEPEFRRLEAWLQDWMRNNPPYLGPNWKCGQEASLRVLHLAATAWIFGQVADASAPLLDLVRLHLRRIAPTIQYAVAQDNNHGTSEAAALFVGGSWLSSAGHPEGERWARMGRRWLEERAARLIAEDGSFSQYSLNYHRLMLETMSFTEAWRRSLGLPRFTDRFVGRCRAATGWLRDMVDPGSGDGPNLGANDGAHVLRWSDAPYRDFRPTLQLASALFADLRAVEGEGSWNQPLHWLGVGMPGRVAPVPQSRVAEDGGFAWLRRGTAVALLRFPRFRFRPSQADLLHVDLRVAGRNLLRDAGTFSYNTDASLMDYFTGAAGHNTVQFDGREPMPRLGRFLFGAWPEASVIEPLWEDGQGVRMGAGYADHAGVRHDRLVELWPDRLRVTDTLSGFAHRAVLRWRLAPDDWVLDAGDRAAGVGTASRDMRLRVTATERWESCRLVEGWESLKYQEKSLLPVLEVCVEKPCTIISEFRWVT
jgi:hypothetical protein